MGFETTKIKNKGLKNPAGTAGLTLPKGQRPQGEGQEPRVNPTLSARI